MRITNNMMISRLLSDLRANQSRLSCYQRMLSSGKTAQAPSDDPVKVMDALRLRSALEQTDQFLKNTEDAINWVDVTDSALGTAGEVLARVRDIILAGASSAVSQPGRESLAAEVGQLVNHLVQVGNTSYDGRYLFAGHRTTDPPFEKNGDDVDYKGDSGTLVRDLGVGVSMRINIPGDQVFSRGFSILKSVIEDLQNGDVDRLSSTRIKEIDEAIDENLKARAEMGARANRLELSQSRLLDMGFNIERLLTGAEDVDYPEVITMLAAEENAYRLALMAGARIIQPSLLDFLR